LAPSIRIVHSGMKSNQTFPRQFPSADDFASFLTQMQIGVAQRADDKVLLTFSRFKIYSCFLWLIPLLLMIYHIFWVNFHNIAIAMFPLKTIHPGRIRTLVFFFYRMMTTAPRRRCDILFPSTGIRDRILFAVLQEVAQWLISITSSSPHPIIMQDIHILLPLFPTSLLNKLNLAPNIQGEMVYRVLFYLKNCSGPTM
jgi:hypothetical protein